MMYLYDSALIDGIVQPLMTWLPGRRIHLQVAFVCAMLSFLLLLVSLVAGPLWTALTCGFALSLLIADVETMDPRHIARHHRQTHPRWRHSLRRCAMLALLIIMPFMDIMTLRLGWLYLALVLWTVAMYCSACIKPHEQSAPKH